MVQGERGTARRYSSKIIKAGALLPDTKLLLESWDLDAGVEENLARVQRENLFGKSSRSRVEDILRVFRQRYLNNLDLLRALGTLVRGRIPSDSLDRILYFQAVQSDLLLHDLVSECLLEWSSRIDPEVRTWEVEDWIRQQVEDGKTESTWSRPVQNRVMQGLLSTLRDFGILEGSVKKRIVPVYLPIDAFAFVALQLHLSGRAGDRLLHDPEWRLFFLSDQAVERFFLEAHQERLLHYQSAGRVVRIDFPAQSLEEYASVLTQRAY